MKINMKRIIKKILLEDKKESFIKAIVDNLVNGTKINYDNERIYFPFYPSSSYFSSFLKYPFFNLSFTKYCKDRFGSSKDEIRHIWDQYSHIIIDKITKGVNLNESEDKKERLLQYVINDLVNGTKINYDNERIYFPFYPDVSLSFNLHLSPSSLYPVSFVEYCKNRFGLSKDEIKYVWYQYLSIIKDKINNKPLNESEGKKERFLQFVINDLLTNTEITYSIWSNCKRVYVPYNNNEYPFLFEESNSDPSGFRISPTGFHAGFFDYVNYRYGVKKEEFYLLFDMYKESIIDKITNK